MQNGTTGYRDSRAESEGHGERRADDENTDVRQLYTDYLGEPLSEKSEELLHTDHTAWAMPSEQNAEDKA